jgi:methyl-accepting chemotaxis protein
MDQVVQQNATLVEQATAATESMNAQAGALLELVSRFRLRQQGQGVAAPAGDRLLPLPAPDQWSRSTAGVDSSRPTMARA